MPWSRRRRRCTVVALLGGGVALLAAAAVSGKGPFFACSTVGYADISPIQLEFDPALRVDTVAACFGTDCHPVALSGSGGEWSVPQSQEYLQSVSPGSITQVTVQATSDGDVVVDQVSEVAREQERLFGWPECPGPYSHLPVTIAP